MIPHIASLPKGRDGAALLLDIQGAYVGRRTADGKWRVVVVDEDDKGTRVLAPPKGRGFRWGDSGPSSRALARALLRDVACDDLARDFAAELLREVVSQLDPSSTWEILSLDLMDWVMARAVPHA